MSRYEEGIKLIEESCGNGKDNVIALSTVVMEPNADGMPSSCVRDVDAYYCLLYTSPSPRDGLLSRMPSSA